MAEIIDTGDLTQSTELSQDEGYWVYNGLDCCVTADVLVVTHPMLDATSQVVYDFSRELQAPVMEMALRGILVNQYKKHQVLRDMRGKLVQLESQLDELIHEGVGIPKLNWRSPVQLNSLLYDVMKLPEVRKKNANGIMARTSNREAIEKLATYFIAEPICNHIMSLRDLGKSIGFLETGIDPDGRIRAGINIAGTNTGRFSTNISDFGTGTNLQNVTSSLRSVFVADPGYKFANLDLEQADARNIGALCWNLLSSHPDWDEASAGRYLDACEGGDLHTTVLKMANPRLPWGLDGKTDREVADGIAYRHLTHRDLSKKLGHGSNFEGQPPTMAKHARLPIPLVKDFQARYFEAFPCIPAWHDSIHYALEHFSQLTTPFSRRRFFFGRPKDPATRREAVAYQPQSMTADEINKGILNLWRANRVQLLMQVHDSILFQYPEHLESEIIPWAMQALRTTLRLAKDRDFTVPIDAQVGWNWGYAGPSNLDGLKKWKGGDDRKRTETEFKLSIRSI